NRRALDGRPPTIAGRSLEAGPCAAEGADPAGTGRGSAVRAVATRRTDRRTPCRTRTQGSAGTGSGGASPNGALATDRDRPEQRGTRAGLGGRRHGGDLPRACRAGAGRRATGGHEPGGGPLTPGTRGGGSATCHCPGERR